MRSRIRNKDSEPGGDEDNLYEGDEEKDKGHVDDGNHLYEDDRNHLYEDDEPPEVAKAEVGDKSRAER